MRRLPKSCQDHTRSCSRRRTAASQQRPGSDTPSLCCRDGRGGRGSPPGAPLIVEGTTQPLTPVENTTRGPWLKSGGGCASFFLEATTPSLTRVENTTPRPLSTRMETALPAQARYEICNLRLVSGRSLSILYKTCTVTDHRMWASCHIALCWGLAAIGWATASAGDRPQDLSQDGLGQVRSKTMSDHLHESLPSWWTAAASVSSL